MLVVASYFCYKALGSDLLPAMDEGGFVLDYITPAGTSLEETNRMIAHIEQMVSQVSEVEGFSRRTGLQLGLAAVTEANKYLGPLKHEKTSRTARGHRLPPPLRL